MAESKPTRPKRRVPLRGLNVRRDVHDELRFHLEIVIEDLVAQGMDLEAAHEEAARRFGRFDRYRDQCRAIGERQRASRSRGETMNNILHDLKYALRTLRSSPLFTFVALATLTLGIGANTLVFTLVNGILLRPLPYEAPEQLVSIWMERADGSDTDGLSVPEFFDLREQGEIIADAGYWVHWGYDITEGDQPERLESARVSANMFSMLGTRPAHGRTFLPEEAEPGRDRVVLISHGLWQRRYGADPAIVGRTLELDGEPYAVVGIMPEGFRFPYEGEYGTGFWTPISMDPAESSRRSRWLNVVGRLSENTTLDQAATEVETIAARLVGLYPESNAEWTMRLRGLRDSVVGDDTRTALWILYGVVAFVLLIACANLANLLLARVESRQREIAVRAALGAGRARLLRQLLTESVLLAMAGGALGLLAANWGLGLFIAIVPTDLPRVDEVNIDGWVLAFAMALAAGTSVLFGLLPAYHASRGDLHDSLKVAGTAVASSGRRRLRGALVAAEVAIALVLLVGAGLLLRSFTLLVGEELGFETDRLLVFQVAPSSRYEDVYTRLGFYREFLQLIEALPDVRLVGANTAPPLSGIDWNASFVIDGRPEPAPGEEPTAQFNVATPDYFRTLGIPLLRGRFFTDDDTRDRAGVVIITEALAGRYWPDEDPIGKRIRTAMGVRSGETYDGPTSYEVVGVVGSVRKLGLDRGAQPEFFLAYTQQPWHFLNFVVRTRGNPLQVMEGVRAQLASIDQSIPIDDIATMEQHLSASVARPRFNLILLGCFAGLALILSTLGIYGVVSYSATQRTHEIGLRMALGAQAKQVFRLVVGQGLILTALGLGIGVGASLALSRLLAGLLYRVTPTDPMTFVAVALLLTIVATVASYVPARRATRVDPLIALRNE